MKQTKLQTRFAICLRDNGSEDLEVGKVYPVLADESAARDAYIRVVDESGQDYLYPADYFVLIELPEAAEHALLAALSSVSSA